MQLHYRSADIELLLLDIMIWRDDEVSLVEEDSGENLDKFTRWTRSQKSVRFDRKDIVLVRCKVVESVEKESSVRLIMDYTEYV